jgi:hypothetical protein
LRIPTDIRSGTLMVSLPPKKNGLSG